MKTLTKKVIPCVILIVVLSLFAWMFGWGGDDINVMAFSSADVTCIRLNDGLHVVVLEEKEDIQAVIDTVNSFQHTGNYIKHVFPFVGLAIGGTALYEFHVYLTDGEDFIFCFGLNDAEQDPADTEVCYWVQKPKENHWFPFSDTCRGSMELFYKLLEQG